MKFIGRRVKGTRPGSGALCEPPTSVVRGPSLLWSGAQAAEHARSHTAPGSKGDLERAALLSEPWFPFP